MAFLIREQPTCDGLPHEGFMVASAVAQLDGGNQWNPSFRVSCVPGLSMGSQSPTVGNWNW